MITKSSSNLAAAGSRNSAPGLMAEAGKYGKAPEPSMSVLVVAMTMSASAMASSMVSAATTLATCGKFSRMYTAKDSTPAAERPLMRTVSMPGRRVSVASMTDLAITPGPTTAAIVALSCHDVVRHAFVGE